MTSFALSIAAGRIPSESQRTENEALRFVGNRRVSHTEPNQLTESQLVAAIEWGTRLCREHLEKSDEALRRGDVRESEREHQMAQYALRSTETLVERLSEGGEA
jgi:hypothetical protein